MSTAAANPLVWGIQAEQAEYRVNGDTELVAWDFDAFIGDDDLRFVWRSKAEFVFDEDAFETLENQFRLQTPISTFFDAVAGVRIDTPDGADRVSGVLGLHGLAPQWFEVDADLYLSEHPALRLEAEYEGLITNRITAIPSVELDLPFTDDDEFRQGAFAPTLELGLRVSYDLIDRAFSPYIGVHYERAFGETASILRDEGEDAGAVFFVTGARIMF